VRIRDLYADNFSVFLNVTVPEAFLLRNGDLVIGMDGDFNVARWQRGAAALNQRLCRLRPRPGTDIRFVEYALPRALSEIHATQYSTTVKHLSSEEVMHCRVPALPVDEQRRIADFLDDQVSRIEQAAVARQAQIRLIETLEAVRCDGAVRNARGTRRGRLKDLLKAPPSYGVLKPGYVDEGVPLVRIVDLPTHGAVAAGSVRRITPQQSVEYARTIVRTGDVLVGVVGTIGRPVIVDPNLDGANLSRAVARLQLRDGVDPRYVRAMLRLPAFSAWTSEITQGTAQAVLNMGDLPNYPIAVPDPADMHDLGAALAAIELEGLAVLGTLKRARQLLMEYKQSLITAAVTGQIDVTTASGRSIPA